jgi:hypothetical protein
MLCACGGSPRRLLTQRSEARQLPQKHMTRETLSADPDPNPTLLMIARVTFCIRALIWPGMQKTEKTPGRATELAQTSRVFHRRPIINLHTYRIKKRRKFLTLSSFVLILVTCQNTIPPPLLSDKLNQKHQTCGSPILVEQPRSVLLTWSKRSSICAHTRAHARSRAHTDTQTCKP